MLLPVHNNSVFYYYKYITLDSTSQENWFSKNNKLIQVSIFRVFSKNEQKKEPIFIFNGEPGTSSIDKTIIDGCMLENHDVE